MPTLAATSWSLRQQPRPCPAGSRRFAGQVDGAGVGAPHGDQPIGARFAGARIDTLVKLATSLEATPAEFAGRIDWKRRAVPRLLWKPRRGGYPLAMPKRSSKPRDVNSLARSIVDEATGEKPEAAPDPDTGKDPAAVELGRRGGLKGGKARAKKLSAKQRSEIAKKAAATRWKDR